MKALGVLEWREGAMGPCYLSLVLFFLLKRELANPRKGMQKCSSSEEGDRAGMRELGQGRKPREGLIFLWSPFLDLDYVKNGRVVGLTPAVIRSRANKGPLSYLCDLLPSLFK